MPAGAASAAAADEANQIGSRAPVYKIALLGGVICEATNFAELL